MRRRLPYPRICIALGFEQTESLLRCAREEADDGGRFFEFRLDYLKRPERGVEAIRTFLGEYPGCDVLATCRRQMAQGAFGDSIENQLSILRDAAGAGARAVDVEIESAAKAKAEAVALGKRADLIISYHNFKNTPGLETVLRRMMTFPAKAFKVVTTAVKPSDIHRVLSLARQHSRTPMIVMAMGEAGFPSRVLAPIYGGLYSYAAPCKAEGTAAGQVSVRQLRHLYRFEKLTRATKVYGVIADPVGHSISPAVHNRGFQARRIDAVYLPFLVSVNRLKDFFELASNVPLAGFSVTIPHKQKVLRYLDIVEPLARRIGAVNTVWRRAGKWRGTNTDAHGVTAPLEKHIRLARSSVLIVGNGGAARAAAFALSDKGTKVAITGRNSERVRRLARVCGAEAIPRDDLETREFDALVHTTPLGMFPKTKECFFEDRIPADVVFDTVYNPLETVLLRRASAQKKVAIPGIRMFMEQAARQFEIWTGGSAPRTVMERAGLEALEAKSGSIIKR